MVIVHWRKLLLLALLSAAVASAVTAFRTGSAAWSVFAAIFLVAGACLAAAVLWARFNDVARCVGKIDEKLSRAQSWMDHASTLIEARPDAAMVSSLIEAGSHRSNSVLTGRLESLAATLESRVSDVGQRHATALESLSAAMATRSVTQARRQLAVETAVRDLGELFVDQWLELRNSASENAVLQDARVSGHVSQLLATLEDLRREYQAAISSHERSIASILHSISEQFRSVADEHASRTEALSGEISKIGDSTSVKFSGLMELASSQQNELRRLAEFGREEAEAGVVRESQLLGELKTVLSAVKDAEAELESRVGGAIHEIGSRLVAVREESRQLGTALATKLEAIDVAFRSMSDQAVRSESEAVERDAKLKASIAESSSEVKDSLVSNAAAISRLLDGQVDVIRDRVAPLLASGMDSKVSMLVDELGSLRSGTEQEMRALGGAVNRLSTGLGEELNRRLDALARGLDAAKGAAATEVTRAATGLVRDVDALLHLHSAKSTTQCEPLLGDWAMDPAGMQAVLRFVRDRRPGLVVECGSGASTLWIARSLKELSGASLVSLEHLAEYKDRLDPDIKALGLESVAEVRLAPLEPRKVGERVMPWYSRAATKFKAGSINLLLVDGPPGTVGKLSRLPALPLLSSALAPGAIVLLDDYGRADENQVGDEWLGSFPRLVKLGLAGPRTMAFEWKAK